MDGVEGNESVDKLILHGTILTLDSDRRMIEDGAIAIRGARITAVGSTSQLQKQYRAEQTLDVAGMYVIPGLINTHTHGGDVLFRGLVEDLSLETWLSRLWKLEKEFVTPETVYLGALLSYIEMVKEGITAAVDMYWHPEAMVKAASILGFRLITGPVFFDPDFMAGITLEDQLVIADEFIERFREDPLITPCLQPHSVYTVLARSLSQIGELARHHDCLLTTHASETKKEVEDCLRECGRSPIKQLDGLGLLSPKTLLAHCVHLGDEDFKILADKNTVISHCPLSNLKLASGIADIDTMLKHGIKVTLGTDGPVSGNDLNPWLTMRLAALMQKTLHSDPTLLDAPQVIEMMTITAAKGLSLEKKIGSLEAGKRADIVVIDNDEIHAIPSYNPYASLVYSIGREDVNTVIINGRIILQNRKLLTVDEDSVKEKVKELSFRIKTFAEK